MPLYWQTTSTSPVQYTRQVEEPFPSNDPEPPTDPPANEEDVGAAIPEVPSVRATKQQSTKRERRSKQGHDHPVKFDTTS